MLIAEAAVVTERSSRYLTQLCRHLKQASQLHPQQAAHVEWTGHHGVISFSSGRCTLRAGPGVLALRVEASDAPTLDLLTQRIGARLEQVGRTDGLAIAWRSAGGDNGGTAS